MRCRLCGKSAWLRGKFLGRHRIHRSCFDQLAADMWDVVHPKIHDGWTLDQQLEAINQLIAERVR